MYRLADKVSERMEFDTRSLRKDLYTLRFNEQKQPGREYRFSRNWASQLEKLVSKQRELKSKEILELWKTTSQSFGVICAFLKGNDIDENKDLN